MKVASSTERWNVFLALQGTENC